MGIYTFLYYFSLRIFYIEYYINDDDTKCYPLYELNELFYNKNFFQFIILLLKLELMI